MQGTPTEQESQFTKQKFHQKFQKSDKEIDEIYLKQIKENGFEQQNAFLQEKGFTQVKKNFKILLKTKGSQAEAHDLLLKKSQKKQEKLEKLKEFDLKYSELATKISQKVDFPQKKVIKLLAKFNGDEQKVTEKLQQKTLKKDMEKLSISKAFNDYSEQMKFLIESGQYNFKKNIKALEKSQGDQVKALQWLSNKNQEKKERKPHEKKERNQEEEKHLTREWQNCITHLVIDGNNCLYVDNDLRKELKTNQLGVEAKILKLAEEFSKKMNVKELILYYDDSKLKYQSDVNGFKSCVITARPVYKTADDAIVEMKDKLPENTMYVTSDRGLHQRLIEKKAGFVMKSGAFFKIAQAELGQEYNQIVKA